MSFRRGGYTDAGAPISAAAECVGTESGWGPYWMRLGGGWCWRGGCRARTSGTSPGGPFIRHGLWRCYLIYDTAESRYKPSPWKGEGAPARTLGRMRVRMSGACPESPLIRQPSAATFPPVGGRHGNMGTALRNRRFLSLSPSFSRTTQASTVGTTLDSNCTQAAAPMGEKPVQIPTSRSLPRPAKSTVPPSPPPSISRTT